MINLTSENKALCFKDSTEKPFFLALYRWEEDNEHIRGGRYKYWKTIESEEIISESLEITDGCSENNEFSLGSYVAPSIKFQRRFDGIDLTNFVAIPVQKIGTQYIAYFDGYVSADENDSDTNISSVTVNSFLTELLNLDVKQAMSIYTSDTATADTVNNIIYGVLGSSSVGIYVTGLETDGISKQFKNSNMQFSFKGEELPDKLTAQEFIKQAGEFLGAHIRLKEKRVLDTLDTLKTYEPTGNATIEFIRIAPKALALPDISYIYSDNTLLPSNYKRIPYIDTDGNQYINTDIKVSENINFEYSYIPEAFTWWGPYVVSGYNFSAPLLGISDRTSGEVRLMWQWFSYISEEHARPSSTYNGIINVSAFKDGKVKINGTEYTATKGTDIHTESDLYIGTYSGDVTNNDYQLKGKLFYLKIYDGNTLVADYIPVFYDDPNKNIAEGIDNSAAGLFDLVSKTFYKSIGAKDFISAPCIDNYTAGYYLSFKEDKNKAPYYSTANVTIKKGTQTYFDVPTSGFGKSKRSFSINDNIFFNALASQVGTDGIYTALRDIASYLDTLDICKQTLRVPYTPFLESGDYVVVDKGKELISPNGKRNKVLKNITVDDSRIYSEELETGFKIGKVAHSFVFDIETTFVLSDKETKMLFKTVGSTTSVHSFTLELSWVNKKLTFYAGAEDNPNTIVFDNVPTGINLNMRFEADGNTIKYSGTLGKGTIEIQNKDFIIYDNNGYILVRGENAKLERVAIWCKNSTAQANNVDIDLYPVYSEEYSKIGIYDSINRQFYSPLSNDNIVDYTSYYSAVPMLSVKTSGIHSMLADVACEIQQ